MALRKPLVMVSGQIQQLQSTDTLDAPVSAIDVMQSENANANPITICMAVYASAAGVVDLAKADAAGTSRAIGLVRAASIANGASGGIITDGVLTATTGQWDGIAGTTGGLAAGTVYYVSKDTAGHLVSAAPSAVGQYVIEVGTALSTTELEVTFTRPVLL